MNAVTQQTAGKAKKSDGNGHGRFDPEALIPFGGEDDSSVLQRF